MSKTEVIIEPRFMGPEGARFFTTRFSCGGSRGNIVFIPPFAEEMNRCRSLVATQARSFARSGYDCTLIDFFGTGDSDGELVDCTLTVWYDNIRAAIESAQLESDAPVILWGLRLGGLLALDYASKNPGSIRDIILWQPVNAAKVYVTQMLRQRVASLMVRDLPPETTTEIRKRLNAGEIVEIAGYEVGGALLSDIEKIDVAAIAEVCSGGVFWLEHVMERGKDIGVASRRAVDQLSDSGVPVDVHTFSDPPIWLIHERDFAPQLLAATDSLLS